VSEFSIRFNSGYDITVPNPQGTDTPTEVQKIIDRLNAVHDYRGTLLKERFKDDLSRLNGRRTVFIGDSITRDNLGYRATVTLAGKPKACNLAVSGTVSAMLLNKFKRSVKSFKPELVSIMIGGNDHRPEETSRSFTIFELAQKAAQVSRLNSVPVIDIFCESGFGYARVKNRDYQNDNIHLNKLGGLNMGNFVWSKLKDIPLWISE